MGWLATKNYMRLSLSLIFSSKKMAEVRPRNIPESFFPLKNICPAGSLTNQVFQRKTCY